MIGLVSGNCKFRKVADIKTVLLLFTVLLGFVVLKFLFKVNNLNSIPECPSSGKMVVTMSMPYVNRPSTLHFTIQSGSSFMHVLKSAGFAEGESIKIINSLKKVHNVNKIETGDRVTIKIDGYGKIDQISIFSRLFLYNIKISVDDQGSYHARIVNDVHNKRLLRVSDTIKSSLFNTAIEQGLSSTTVMKLINLYNHSVDLKKEITPGSKVDILLEKFFDENDRPVLDGRILYASLQINDRVFNIYNHVLPNGEDGYFDDNGVSIKKGLFQLPLSGNFRISSKFGYRYHPVYKQKKFHNGVDFAASLGTPISAAADGVVEFIGGRGGYGKYIKIKHDKLYSTAYAHIGKFQRELKVGSKVRKGQVIAFVGNTGVSTGPHLHYEIIRNGKPVDPLAGDYVTDIHKLSTGEMADFKATVSRVQEVLSSDIYSNEFLTTNTKAFSVLQSN